MPSDSYDPFGSAQRAMLDALPHLIECEHGHEWPAIRHARCHCDDRNRRRLLWALFAVQDAGWQLVPPPTLRGKSTAYQEAGVLLRALARNCVIYPRPLPPTDEMGG